MNKTFLALTTSLAVLAGCGGGDGSDGGSTADCGSQYNPATSVQASFSSFDVSEPERLDRHMFLDVIAGVQPEPGSANETYGRMVADDVFGQTAHFNGGQPTSGATAYTSVRNPLDLINLVIGEGTIDNFNVGRRYISTCIDAGNAAQYSTSANDRNILFQENQDGEVTDTYNYPVLTWVYSPDEANKVIRVVRYQGRSGDSLITAAVGVQFDDLAFTAVGFNPPELLTASFTADNSEERLGLQQDFLGPDRDEWIRSSDNTFDFADQTGVDCARVVIDYAQQQAEVFTSTCSLSGSDCDDPAKRQTGYTRTNDYCGNFEDGTGTSYATQAVSGRQ
ncbi:hypothetical protein EZI54_19005 [Marinobacter halodurans]|uniref:Lipoprotein n=1 Tax=Marinobacter halodurans TaxID=2528979 RepID=A0ABY1ZFI7_9GAMM|nr:hypothetical protein [Marinobacter halodurans]TBW49805.1 hypothetical protein EZI54_19005 [Marinobacter halodurans]